MRLRYALRALRHTPWYSVSAIAVLAVAIGLGTVVFAVVDGLLFKPLPYKSPGELNVLRAEAGAVPRQDLSPLAWQEIEGWTSAVPELAWTAIGSRPTEFPWDGVSYKMAAVDERFFDSLGIRPLHGGFEAADFDWQQPGGRSPQLGAARSTDRSGRAVLISHRLWLRALGGEPSAVGRSVVVSERHNQVFAVRIAGVLAADFLYPIDVGDQQPDLLTPITREYRARTDRAYHVVLRMPAVANADSVRTRLAAVTRDLTTQRVPGGPHDRGARPVFDRVTLDPIERHLASRVRPAFRLTFVAASVLLLAACLNVAALAAVRTVGRQRELLVRRALGATRWELATLHLVEVGILGAAATGVAWVAAGPLLDWTRSLFPATLTLVKPPSLDERAMAAAAVFALTSVAVVALWPLFTAVRLEAGAPGRIRSGVEAGSTSTRISRRSAALLVSMQVALGFVLLIAGVLTVASLAAAMRNDLGYRSDRMILLEASVRRYVSSADAQEQLEGAAAFVSRMPGVESSAVSTIQPTFLYQFNPYNAVIPEGRTAAIDVSVRLVSREFFEVMGLRLIEGRLPAAGEWQSGLAVAVVGESAARTLWPDRSAIGRTLVPVRGPSDAARLTVIGVVGDARFEGRDRDPTREVYLPGAIALGRTGLLFHVRTSGDPEAMLTRLTRDLTAQGMRVDRAATHAAGLFESIKDLALSAWLFAALALAALAVVVLGIGGLVAMSAVQRTREFGVRVALGATRGHVLRMLIREQFAAVINGIVAGGVISAWVVTFLRSQLYGIEPHNPVAWSLAAAMMIAVTLLAAAIPAIRATGRNPVDILRAE
jgi:putative ABC transport system permease protein